MCEFHESHLLFRIFIKIQKVYKYCPYYTSFSAFFKCFFRIVAGYEPNIFLQLQIPHLRTYDCNITGILYFLML
jgi:hypothetical protein